MAVVVVAVVAVSVAMALAMTVAVAEAAAAVVGVAVGCGCDLALAVALDVAACDAFSTSSFRGGPSEDANIILHCHFATLPMAAHLPMITNRLGSYRNSI